jgi:endonuclease III related protein
MIVGAFLVQNTAWSNVEKAIARLKTAGMLSPEAIQRTSEGELAGLIRSSGYFRQKAKKVKAFVAHLFARHGGSLERLLSQDAGALRQELLALHGVGPETADSIVLYAANQPIFVVDAYTRRLLDRLGLLRQPTYDAVQAYCHARLPLDAPLFNELHALIVRHSVVHCRARPICAGCPLLDVCPTGARNADGQRLP